MVTIENEYFSLKQICESGQCFRLELLGEAEGKDGKVSRQYGLPAFGKYIKVGQCGSTVCFSCTQEEFDSVWKDYFDLEEDYGRLISSIDPADVYLSSAAAFGRGIRILRQDLWEMIISFIISQQNNIKRIRQCISVLCRRYGVRQVSAEGDVYYAFPGPEAFMDARLEDLYACNLGYRSRYVKETAGVVCRGEVDLDALCRMDYEEAMKELMRFYGVGMKVANCVCLFALHHTDAFPVDTHINKVLGEQYPDGFPFEKYVGYAGSLQQYIFYYDLMNGKRIKGEMGSKRIDSKKQHKEMKNKEKIVI